MQRFPAGQPSLLRSINERAVLEIIAAAGPLARTELAQRSGLSKPTVSLALTALTERGVVEEVGRATGRKGPAALLYQLNPRSGWSIGIDVGHQRIRVAAVDLAGEVRASREAAVPRTRAALIRRVAELAERAIAEGGADADAVRHVVVGVPAVVAPNGRDLSYAEGLPSAGHGVGAALADALPWPVTLENDVNLAAIAERAQGLGRGVDDFVLIGLGRGIGLGTMIGGRLHRGATGAAGEAGYLPSDEAPADGARAASPRLTLEPTIGARHIERLARTHGLAGELTARSVFERARERDEKALAIVDDTAAAIAYVIACVAPILDPSLVILGGAIGANPDLLEDGVGRHLALVSPFRPRIESSSLGSRAVLVGACVTATELTREATFAAMTGSPASSI